MTAFLSSLIVFVASIVWYVLKFIPYEIARVICTLRGKHEIKAGPSMRVNGCRMYLHSLCPTCGYVYWTKQGVEFIEQHESLPALADDAAAAMRTLRARRKRVIRWASTQQN